MLTAIFLSYAAVTFAALSCPASNNTQFSVATSTFNIHCGVDYYGGDLFYLSRISSFEQCLTLCAANPLCKDVAYIPSLRRCYLKSTFTPARNNPAIWGAVLTQVESELTCSYFKSNGTIYTTSQGRRYQILCGTDSRSNDIAQVVSLTLEGCVNFCDRTSGCVSVAMRNNICYAKNRVNTLTSNSRVALAIFLGPLSTTITTATTATTTTSTTTTTTPPPSPTEGPATCEFQPTPPALHLPSPTPIFVYDGSNEVADDNTFLVTLPDERAITLYGFSSNSFYASPNGAISLTSDDINLPSMRRQVKLPSTNLGDYALAVFWYDFVIGTGSGIWYSIDNNVLSIEWRVTLYDDREQEFPPYSTFQVQYDFLTPNLVTYNYYTNCGARFPVVGVQKNNDEGYSLGHPAYTPRNGWQIVCDTTVTPGTCVQTR